MRIHNIDAGAMPLREHFFVAGASCSVSTNSQAVMDALAGWRSSRDDAHSRSFRLTVLVDTSAERSSDTTPHFRGMHHLVTASFGESELFVFDLSRRTVSGVVSKQAAEDARFWRTLLLPISVGVIGAVIGVVPMHAACVDWRGKGLMIAGASGAGKSTLAVALSRRGFSLVSDDWTYVAQEGGKLTAYGISAPVKLLADAQRLFPELAAFQPAKSLNGEVAFELDAGTVFGSAVRSQSDPRWLVLLERREQTGCEFKRLSGGDMSAFFERSAERLPAQLQQAAVGRSQTIAELAKCDCWSLRYGGAPQVAAEALRGFCEGT